MKNTTHNLRLTSTALNDSYKNHSLGVALIAMSKPSRLYVSWGICQTAVGVTGPKLWPAGFFTSQKAI